MSLSSWSGVELMALLNGFDLRLMVCSRNAILLNDHMFAHGDLY